MDRTRGDFEETLAEVFRANRESLWGFFLRGCRDRGSAEDLLQEVYLRLWERRERLAGELGAGEDAVRLYLWRTARHLMIDEIRFRQRGRALLADDDASLLIDDRAADPAPGPEATAEKEELVGLVREAVERLTHPRGRECMRLWLEGKDLLTIAAETGLATGQVRGLLQRAKETIVLRASGLLAARRDARGAP